MVIGSFFPEVTGGGLQAFSLMSALKEKVRFYVVSTVYTANLPGEDVVEGVKVFRVSCKGKQFFWKIKAFARFTHIFLNIKNKIDIVHLHGFSQKSILFIILAKVFGKKVVEKTSSLGVDDPFSIRKGKIGWLNFFFYSRCDAFVSIAPAISGRFRNSPLKNRVFFIPNGINLKRFRPLDSKEQKLRLKQELGLKPHCKTILYVGFFSYDKSPHLLWNGYRNLRSGPFRNSQLLFVGSRDSDCFEVSSKLVQQLKRDIEESDIKKDVLFVEKTLSPEKYYQASDIYVLPSKREGLSNSLLEAMACGLPCVATRLRGITDYLITEGKDGLLFESGNEIGLGNKLNKLLSNEEYALGLGVRAALKVKKLFSMDLVSDKYFKMYRQLAKKEN